MAGAASCWQSGGGPEKTWELRGAKVAGCQSGCFKAKFHEGQPFRKQERVMLSEAQKARAFGQCTNGVQPENTEFCGLFLPV